MRRPAGVGHVKDVAQASVMNRKVNKHDMFEQIVTHYPDFPKKGIDFIDVLPFLRNREAFGQAVAEIDRLNRCPNVATVEARGFLFAAPLLTVGQRVRNIVPLRKKGKLPFAEGDLRRVCIEKEYGSDEVFYRLSDIAAGVPDAASRTFRLTLFDDLLATGGTALGIAQALNAERVVVDGVEYGVQVDQFIFLVELPALGGRKPLEGLAPVSSLLSLEGVE